jgi:hypothetical protein
MRLSKLQGTAAPPSSVPLFPCSICNMFNDLYMKYDLQSVSGQEISLVFRPNLSHVSELLGICTTLHLRCTMNFSFFCSTMMMWSHSGPFFPPINIYNITYWEELKVGGGAQGPVSQNCTSNPLNDLRILELSRTKSNPCSQ